MSTLPSPPDPSLSAEELALLAEIEGPVREPRVASVRAPRKPRVPREERPVVKRGPPHAKGRALARVALQEECVAMRVAGKKYSVIADHLGVSASTARKVVDQWIASQAPSESQTESLRHLMQERLETLYEVYYPIATGTGVTKRGTPREEPNEKAGEFLLKVMDRHSRLMGVDMVPSSVTIAISAEAIATFLGWDERAPEAIDVTPVELEAGEEAA